MFFKDILGKTMATLAQQMMGKDSPSQLLPQAAPLSAATGGPTDEEIRELAYQKWENAGRPETDGVFFWLLAEEELKKPTPFFQVIG